MRNKLLKIALSLFIASFILAGLAGTASAAETLTITSVTQQASDPVTYAKICFQYSNPTAITSGAQMLEGYYNVSGSTWTYFQVVESERRKYPCQIFQLPTKLGAGVYNVRIRVAGTSIYSNVMQLRIGKFYPPTGAIDKPEGAE